MGTRLQIAAKPDHASFGHRPEVSSDLVEPAEAASEAVSVKEESAGKGDTLTSISILIKCQQLLLTDSQ